MSEQPRSASPERREVPKEIAELSAVVSKLPAEVRTQIDPVLDRVMDSARRRRRILNLVQDALSQLRLDMKYLMFDLEATRRERDEYRRQVDEA